MSHPTNRRAPADTAHSSWVIFPSALFSLEKDEVYPYERFAYNVLRVGVEALHKSSLPACITVDFTRLLAGCSPWTINASVIPCRDHDGKLTKFEFQIPELVPAILYLLTASVVSDFSDDAAFNTFRTSPTRLRDKVRLFADSAKAGIRCYQEKGFGFGIRAAYDRMGLTFPDLERCANDYDLLTQQIAYHEVAHATTLRSHSSQVQKMGLELIADLLATQWFYYKMIVNTPDTEQYRQFRGVDSYAQSIFANSLATLRSQQAIMILMAIAGAQRTGGAVSLAGGASHPPGLQRYFLQHAHLYTLIRSNFSTVLSAEQFQSLDEDWDARLDTLFQAGVIPYADLLNHLDVSECDTIEVAANLIEELKILELQKAVPTLRSIRAWMSNALRKGDLKR